MDCVSFSLVGTSTHQQPISQYSSSLFGQGRDKRGGGGGGTENERKQIPKISKLRFLPEPASPTATYDPEAT